MNGFTLSGKINRAAMSAWVFLFVCILAPAGWPAKVILEDGGSHEGRVLVREDVVTIHAAPGLKGVRNLYQFPVVRVSAIETRDDTPTVINSRVVVRAQAAEDSEPLFEFEKGLVVKRLAVQGDWVQVEGWDSETKGFVPASALSTSIEYTPEEQAAARNRLNLIDPPPPAPPRPPARRSNSGASSAEAEVPDATESATVDPEE